MPLVSVETMVLATLDDAYPRSRFGNNPATNERGCGLDVVVAPWGASFLGNNRDLSSFAFAHALGVYLGMVAQRNVHQPSFVGWHRL